MSFSVFNDHYWPTRPCPGDGLLDRSYETKDGFEFFYCNLENLFIFAFFSSFLYDLFTNKTRKLEVAESNPIMENILISFSLCRLGFLSYSFSFTSHLSLSRSLACSLSLSLSLFVEAPLQLLLCGVMSLSLILNNN